MYNKKCNKLISKPCLEENFPHLKFWKLKNKCPTQYNSNLERVTKTPPTTSLFLLPITVIYFKKNLIINLKVHFINYFTFQKTVLELWLTDSISIWHALNKNQISPCLWLHRGVWNLTRQFQISGYFIRQTNSKTTLWTTQY